MLTDADKNEIWVKIGQGIGVNDPDGVALQRRIYEYLIECVRDIAERGSRPL